MSLYWQQAVQNRGTAPANGAQGHNQGHVDPQIQWQNVNLEASSAATNAWNQVPVTQSAPQTHYHNSAHSQQYATNNQGYAEYNGQVYTMATPSNSNVSIQHTPLLNTPESHAHVQEHPKVDLSPAPSENKPSQVTPESTYSVDTFSSLTKDQEKNQEDDWDDWEHTPKEEQEKSPRDVGSIVSEPVLMLHSDKSRETSVASGYEQQNGYDFYNHDAERSPEAQPVVAQVAPLIKNSVSDSSDPLIARVGPVSQTAADHASNVGRVAPTRPVQATSRQPAVESAHEHQGNEGVDPTALSVPVQSVPQMAASALYGSFNDAPMTNNGPAPRCAAVNNVEQEIVVEHTNPASEAPHLSMPQSDLDRVTPEITPSLNGDSPGEAQATSTPLTAERQEDQRVVERRSSVSSIRGAGIVPPKPPSIANGEHSDSTQGSIAFSRGGPRASYQERFKSVKEHYMDSRNKASYSMNRLERMRAETPKTNKSNPLAEVNVSGRRSILQISARSANKADPSNSTYAADKTVYSHPDASLDQSIDIGGNNSVGYGDDFVDASRRSRLNRSRPASRAKSDVGGDDVPFHRGHHGHRNRQVEMGYSGQHQYYGHPSMGRHGRVSVAGMPYQLEYYQQQQAMMYHNQRPQSTFDHRSMERFQRAGGNMNMSYDAYDHHGPVDDDLDESVSDESEIDDEQGESEDEMRAYNMHRGAVNNSFSSYSMTGHQRRHVNHYGPEEIYYFGLIRLEVSAVEQVFRHMPPPPEFYSTLDSMGKAAYLYYACVYSKLFSQGVVAFNNMFQREFYKYICDGDSKNNAFIKICKSMYDQLMQRRVNSQQKKAYEASQKQLFSDDRDSADGLSDRASVYDHRDDDRASDILSVDNSHRAPLKFRTPHAFMTFGPGGIRITMQPDKSVSVVHTDEVRSSLRDNQSRRIIDAARNFKGPLTAGRTAPHSIWLYIQTQISRIRSSEVAKENPYNCDVVDCLLLWQLLETVVQQQGRVNGPDIARLLISAGASTSKRIHQNHREKSATPSMESTRSNAVVDPKAFDRFTQFLLGGHVDEAVDCAVRDGLYADAMVLVRRMYGNDLRKLAEIEAKFLATRPASNPVMTLVSVASELPAPVLSNPPIDDAGSWRSHAAIVLANLNTPHALQTVYNLGRVLAKREYQAAADFCFLSVALLSGFQGTNVFQPVAKTEQEGNERCHVTLIHASLPDDEWDSTSCRFGFSLTDLHATEIFDYAIRLPYANQNFVSPLQNSAEYQQRRLQYAQLLASFGGFNSEAFRYLMSVASSIWYYAYMFPTPELIQLADLAESLRFYADEDPNQHVWIDQFRSRVLEIARNPVPQVPQEVQQPAVEQPAANNGNQDTSIYNEHAQYNQQLAAPVHHAEEEFNPIASRSRSESLAVEAHDWHADRQDPIQMSPRTSIATPPPVQVTSPPVESYQTPRGRADSHSSHTSKMGYGEQLCHTQHQQYHQPAAPSFNQGYDEESTPTDSTAETSHESTPVRQRTTSSTTSAVTTEVWRPAATTTQMPYVPEQAYQNYPIPVTQTATTSIPSSQHQTITAPPVSASAPQKPAQPQVNGLKKGGSNNSSGVFSSFINTVRQKIPGNKEMKLPDDSKPTIRWDETLGKWVGDGVEEETVAAPPPKMDIGTAPAPAPSTPTGLRAARGGGGSRYFNPLAGANNTNAAPVPAQIAPPTMPAMSFNFIPTMPDDAETVDPFSGVSDPIVHGAEQPVASS